VRNSAEAGGKGGEPNIELILSTITTEDSLHGEKKPHKKERGRIKNRGKELI